MSGSSNLASELTTRLSHQVDSYAASFAEPPRNSGNVSPEEELDTFDSEGTSTSRTKQEEDHIKSLSLLSSALSKVRGSHGSVSAVALDKVKTQVDETLHSHSSNSRYNKNYQRNQLEWLLSSHLAVSAWGSILNRLMEQAQQVRDEEEYWQGVEGEDASGLMYLIQSGFCEFTLGCSCCQLRRSPAPSIRKCSSSAA